MFYLGFKKAYLEGLNTFARMKVSISELENEKFSEYEKLFKKERFFLELFSDKVRFGEIYNYFKYLNEETEYITMHKTKGSGIRNVLVVLDEYFWNKYSFKTIFDTSESDIEKRLYNQKLFYVACSRAIDNLVCIKLIIPEEENNLISYFDNYERLEV